MQARLRFCGVGHQVGSEVVSNEALAQSLGLESDWFITHTGIRTRHVCADGENVMTLAYEAVVRACADANLSLGEIGEETVVIHIQNGFTHLTPPGNILLCNSLGLTNVRTFAIDGVCSEPITGLELAALMLEQGVCSRVILSAAADFVAMIRPTDPNTAGLFGAGAGAVVLERANGPVESTGIKGLHWLTRSSYWDLGTIPVLDHAKCDGGVSVTFGYYEMRGIDLARITLKTVPKVLQTVLREAGWALDDVDLFVTHQPNAKLLEIGVQMLGVSPNRVEMPVTAIGNMGPASLFVALSLAKETGRVQRGSKIIMLSFGLGFSCGGAAIVW